MLQASLSGDWAKAAWLSPAVALSITAFCSHVSVGSLLRRPSDAGDKSEVVPPLDAG